MEVDALTKHPAFRQIALKYPHIGIKMKAYWGTKKFDVYMHELFTDTRNGERRGFPAQDLELLKEIQTLHDSFHRDVWIYTR